MVHDAFAVSALPFVLVTTALICSLNADPGKPPSMKLEADARTRRGLGRPRTHGCPFAHSSNLLSGRYFQHSPRRRPTRWSQSNRQ